MKTRAAFSLGLSALILGGTVVGCTQHGGVASASTFNPAVAQKQAAVDAAKADKALAKGKTGAAVKFAEAAVGLQPQNADYRVLLGSAYLKAGRFDSARQTYADAMSLDPANGKAALNLALAQIGSGKWDEARVTLDTHKNIIPASDRGLALALAGDPQSAVELLVSAVRGPDADAKTRQNLALSLALAGRWRDARTMAALDLSPADVDKRIMQWASFAQPKSASDQVAALLGVVPVADPGQPAVLALNAPASMGLASATPVDAYMPKAPDGAEAAATEMGMPVPAAAAAPAQAVAVNPAQPVPAVGGVRFAARQEVVQSVPVQVATPAVAKVSRPAVVAVVRPVAMGPVAAPAKGHFFVQLGAFDSAGVAHDAWGRATRRYAAFAGQSPSGMSFSTNGKTFYRLSVGGFARPDAVKLCKTYRGKGGHCFVRAGAGDQVASWKKSVQFASR